MTKATTNVITKSIKKTSIPMFLCFWYVGPFGSVLPADCKSGVATIHTSYWNVWSNEITSGKCLEYHAFNKCLHHDYYYYTVGIVHSCHWTFPMCSFCASYICPVRRVKTVSPRVRISLHISFYPPLFPLPCLLGRGSVMYLTVLQ